MTKGPEVHTMAFLRCWNSNHLSGTHVAEMSSSEARLVLVWVVAMGSPEPRGLLCGNRKVWNGLFPLAACLRYFSPLSSPLKAQQFSTDSLGYVSAVSVLITHGSFALSDRFMISSILSSNRREKRKNSALSEPTNAKQVSVTCTESQRS